MFKSIIFSSIPQPWAQSTVPRATNDTFLLILGICLLESARFSVVADRIKHLRILKKDYFSSKRNLSVTFFHSSASAGGSNFRVIFGQISASSLLSSK